MKPNYLIKHFFGTFVFFSIIFFSAGRIDYFQGLLYVAIGLTMAVLNYTVLRIDRDLSAERSKPGDGTKSWDKAILGLSLLATIAMYCVAGLDSGRYNWSPEFHWSLCALGAFLTASGQLLFLLAQKQNKFFSSTVRIQTERGHAVCDTGLYSVVRHPAYMGMLIQTIGFPLIFGSLWSIIPVSASIVLLLVRTYLEDRTLKTELNGYALYCTITTYRLVPFVW
jgi:protein-S-isoprenylcysteine O-methyltransferase Ste14